MTQSSGKGRGKIRATQRWLNRAEEHFNRNASTRGEMELLLAEAELRSTHETIRHNSHNRWKASWLYQGIAFGLAAFIVVLGIGAVWWWQPERNQPISVRAISAPVPELPVSTHTVQTQNISTVSGYQQETPPTATVDSTNSGQEVKRTDKSADREPSMSQEEMKRLIQTAGQSLRGRTKP